MIPPAEVLRTFDTFGVVQELHCASALRTARHELLGACVEDQNGGAF